MPTWVPPHAKTYWPKPTQTAARYVSKRRKLDKSQKKVGNFLSKPDLVLQPEVVRETRFEKEQLSAGGKFEARGMKESRELVQQT